MTTPVTDLQQQEENQNVAVSAQAAAPQQLNPAAGGTMPAVYQSDALIKQMQQQGPGVNPPSNGEIHQQMWLGSMMMALMAGLAGGNPQAAIVGGMWAAIGIHDYGNTLQQRAKYVPQLQKDGYSMPAILKWYEDGDNKELDSERQNMLERDRLTQQHQQFEEGQANQNERQERQIAASDARQEREIAAANERQAVSQRFSASQSALNREASTRAQDRADARQERADEVQGWAEVRPAVANSQAKQIQLGMAEKDLANMDAAEKAGDKDAMAAAYNNYREHMGRAIIGGTGMLESGEIERVTGLPDLAGAAWNKGLLSSTGMPSKDQMQAYHNQTKYDIENETEALQEAANNQYQALVAGGVDPQTASRRTNRMFGGTSIGTKDYTKPSAPATEPVHATAAPESGKSYTGANGVTFTVKAVK